MRIALITDAWQPQVMNQGLSLTTAFHTRSEAFGLVMLEAMACGTPVAAFPVDGPLEVLDATQGARGGVLHEDLQRACFETLQVPRSQARQRALDFS